MAENTGDAFDRINRPRQESADARRRTAEEAARVRSQLSDAAIQQLETDRQKRLSKTALTAELRRERGKPLPVSPAVELVRKVGAECVAEFRKRGIPPNFSIPNVYRDSPAIIPEMVFDRYSEWRRDNVYVRSGELIRDIRPSAGRFLGDGKRLKGWSITTHAISSSGSSGTTTEGQYYGETAKGVDFSSSATSTGYSPSMYKYIGAMITTRGRVIGWSQKYLSNRTSPEYDFMEIPPPSDTNECKYLFPHSYDKINFAKDLNPDSLEGWEDRIHELGAVLVFNAVNPDEQKPFPVR